MYQRIISDQLQPDIRCIGNHKTKKAALFVNKQILAHKIMRNHDIRSRAKIFDEEHTNSFIITTCWRK